MFKCSTNFVKWFKFIDCFAISVDLYGSLSPSNDVKINLYEPNGKDVFLFHKKKHPFHWVYLFRNFLNGALRRNDQQIGLFDGLCFGLNWHVNLVSHIHIVHKLNGGCQGCWINHRIKTVR